MTRATSDEARRVRDALDGLWDGLFNAHELVVRARFLLAGDALQPGDALVQGAAQAAALGSETDQNPSGE